MVSPRERWHFILLQIRKHFWSSSDSHPGEYSVEDCSLGLSWASVLHQLKYHILQEGPLQLPDMPSFSTILHREPRIIHLRYFFTRLYVLSLILNKHSYLWSYLAETPIWNNVYLKTVENHNSKMKINGLCSSHLFSFLTSTLKVHLIISQKTSRRNERNTLVCEFSLMHREEDVLDDSALSDGR